jgi:uncharacterized membrane protein
VIPLWWCRIAIAALVVLQPLWFGWIQPPTVISPWVVVAITTLPLLIVLPGCWQLRARSLVIAGCLLLFYFCLAVMEAWANPAARGPAVAQILLIVIFFTALPAVRKQPAGRD